jgi:hypothetical protein
MWSDYMTVPLLHFKWIGHCNTFVSKIGADEVSSILGYDNMPTG